MKISDRVSGGLLALLAFLVYLVTLAPTVATVFDDSLEFQLVLPTLGIAHPTGYPLYTLLGWVFTRLVPWGDAAYRANLFSAVIAAVTVALLYGLTRTVVGARLPALVATVLFALSPLWWSQATLAEVYTLHGLFVVLLWLIAFLPALHVPWPAGDSRSPGYRNLQILAFVLGLSLAHHRLTILLVPGLALWVYWREAGDWEHLRGTQLLSRILGLALPFGAPLLLYAYVYIRAQSIPTTAGTWLNTWTAFWQHVTASAYGTFFSAAATPAPDPVAFLSRQFGTLAALVGLWGLFPWPLQMRRWFVLLGTFVLQVLFVLNYRTSDAEVFYLPAAVLFTLFMAAGLVQAQDTLAIGVAQVRRSGVRLPGRYAIYRGAIQIGLAALVLQSSVPLAARALTSGAPGPLTCEQVLAVGGLSALDVPDRRDAWSTFDCAQDVLSQPLEPQATLVGLLGEMTLVRYFQQTYGQRSDLQTVVADAEAPRRAAVAAALAAGRPVYLLRNLDGLAGRYRLDALGPLIRVSIPGMAPAPEPAGLPVAVAMTPALEVVAAAAWPVPVRTGRVQRIALTWLVRVDIADTYQVSARLVDAQGRIVAQYDAQPVHRSRPTTTWLAGDRIVDVYDLALPVAPAGPLTPQIILYRIADGREVARLVLEPVLP